MELYQYSAYGHLIESNFKPPLYCETKRGSLPRINITYHYGVEKNQNNLSLINTDKRGVLRLYSDNNNAYHITHANDSSKWATISNEEIKICNLLPEVRMPDYLWSLVNPTALSFSFRQKFMVVIHGSAIVDNETGYATLLIAPSGSGKSTLSVSLATSDRFTLLTDDMIVISKEKDLWFVHQGFSYSKLYPEMIRFLLQKDGDRYPTAHSRTEKRIVPFTEFCGKSNAQDKAPISRIIYITRSFDKNSTLSRLPADIGKNYVNYSLTLDSQKMMRLLYVCA